MTPVATRFYLPLLVVTLLSGCGTSPRLLAPVLPAAASAQSATTTKPTVTQPVSITDRADLTEAVRIHFPAGSLVGAGTIDTIDVQGPAQATVVPFKVTVRRFMRGYVQEWQEIPATGTLNRQTGRVTWN